MRWIAGIQGWRADSGRDGPAYGVPLTDPVRIGVGVMAAVPAAAMAYCPIGLRTFLCSIGAAGAAGQFAAGLAFALAPFVQDNNPVLRQMTPRSAFQHHIDSRGDAYPGVAIVNTVWGRWTASHLIADSRHGAGPGNTANCGLHGRRYVQAVDKQYHRKITFGIIGTILGFVHPSGFAVGLANFRQAAGLRALDLIDKRVSVGGDEGDAVVPARSQSGPATGTWRTVRIDDSDSHVSVHRSLFRVGPVVRSAIISVRDQTAP